ncbi:hypothetical protein N6N75_24880, partial [Escherichia albertii]|nr:hypothetical protein [Escherichia albertii]
MFAGSDSVGEHVVLLFSLLDTYGQSKLRHLQLICQEKGMKTIGLLGGMSWESTIPYYRLINEGIKQR